MLHRAATASTKGTAWKCGTEMVFQHTFHLNLHDNYGIPKMKSSFQYF